jgi:hypothetical protein
MIHPTQDLTNTSLSLALSQKQKPWKPSQTTHRARRQPEHKAATVREVFFSKNKKRKKGKSMSRSSNERDVRNTPTSSEDYHHHQVPQSVIAAVSCNGSFRRKKSRSRGPGGSGGRRGPGRAGGRAEDGGGITRPAKSGYRPYPSNWLLSVANEVTYLPLPRVKLPLSY